MTYLRPDGKTQVTVEYEDDKPVRVHTVVVSTQHNPDVSQEQIREDVIREVIRPVVPAELLDDDTILLRQSDRPVCDRRAPRGFRPDGPEDHRRYVRRLRKARRRSVLRKGSDQGRPLCDLCRPLCSQNVVAAGLADRCEIELAYAIGIARPVSVRVDTHGTGALTDAAISALVEKHFDFRPAAIIRDLDLRAPSTGARRLYGHFGRTDLDLPWERTDKGRRTAEGCTKDA